MPGRALPRRAVVLALALTGAVGLAGCGGNGDAEQQNGNGDGNGEVAELERNEVTEAAAATTAAGTARVGYEAMFTGAEGSYALNADGDVDYETHRSRLLYDMSDLPGVGAEDVEVRFDGATIFVRFPEGAGGAELPEGKEWVRLPPQEPADAGEETPEGEAPLPQLDLAGAQQDPTQFLRYLVTGAAEVQEEGTEDVRGEQTTIYTALIDMDRVVAAGGEGLGEDEAVRDAGLRQAEGLREQLGDAQIPVTVNVDAEGRIVRLLVSFDLQSGAAGGAVSALTTTEYYDFGTDVRVEPPPEEQVVDAADV